MKRLYSAAALIAVVALACPSGLAAANSVEYEFVELPTLAPGQQSSPSQVNDRRQVSGTVSAGSFSTQRAVRWDVAADGTVTVTDIGAVASRPMFGSGLNDLGHLVGVSFGSTGQFAYRWTGGSPLQLDNGFESPPNGGLFASSAAAISDEGWVCGSACASANGSLGPWNAVVWDEDGTMRSLGTLGGEWSFGYAINGRRAATGRSEFSPSSFATRGFRWTEDDGMESLDVLPGHVSSQGRGLNNHGDVAGTSSKSLFFSGPDTLGAVWGADGTTRTLDPIGTAGVDDLYSDAWAINDAGWVVGRSSLGTFLQFAHPVLWLPDGSKVDLFSLLPTAANWASAVSISNTGWIAGLYRTGGSSGPPTAFVLRPTPATQIAMLEDQVDRAALGESAKGMQNQLELALATLTDDAASNDHASAGLLEAFVREVERLQRLGDLDRIEAASLLAVANDALTALQH